MAFDNDPKEVLTTDECFHTVELIFHRVIGFSFEIAYWHKSWQNAWAIEDFLRFEGREDEIRRDKFYGEYFGSKEVVYKESNPNVKRTSTDNGFFQAAIESSSSHRLERQTHSSVLPPKLV